MLLLATTKNPLALPGFRARGHDVVVHEIRQKSQRNLNINIINWKTELARYTTASCKSVAEMCGVAYGQAATGAANLAHCPTAGYANKNNNIWFGGTRPRNYTLEIKYCNRFATGKQSKHVAVPPCRDTDRPTPCKRVPVRGTIWGR